MEIITVEMTHHSCKRIRERMGINNRGTERIANLALHKGITHAEATGDLKKYMTEIYLSHCTSNNMRIYNNKIFIFHNVRLITVLQLPGKFMSVISKIKDRRNRVLVLN